MNIGGNGGALDDLSNTGAVTGNDFVGGLVGRMDPEYSLTNSQNQGDVAGNIGVGGAAGEVSSSNVGPLSNISNSGNISGASRVGGIGGDGLANTSTKLQNTGSVTSTGNYAGGIVGYSNSGDNVSEASNSGAVSGADYVGGIMGYLSGTGSIADSANRGTVTGAGNAAGIIGFADNVGMVLDHVVNLEPDVTLTCASNCGPIEGSASATLNDAYSVTATGGSNNTRGTSVAMPLSGFKTPFLATFDAGKWSYFLSFDGETSLGWLTGHP